MSGRVSTVSPSEIALIAEWRESGVTIELIARRLSRPDRPLTKSAITAVCLREAIDAPDIGRCRNVNPRGPFMRGGKIVRPFTPDEDAAITEMASAGSRYSEIAAALGRGSSSIYRRGLTLGRYDARVEEAA